MKMRLENPFFQWQVICNEWNIYIYISVLYIENLLMIGGCFIAGLPNRNKIIWQKSTSSDSSFKHDQIYWVKGDSRDGKFPILFPYLLGFWTGSGMGIVWETYHKGVALFIGGPWKSHWLIFEIHCGKESNTNTRMTVTSRIFRHFSCWDVTSCGCIPMNVSYTYIDLPISTPCEDVVKNIRFLTWVFSWSNTNKWNWLHSECKSIVGVWTNPCETYESKWIISLGGGGGKIWNSKQCLKPPAWNYSECSRNPWSNLLCQGSLGKKHISQSHTVH